MKERFIKFLKKQGVYDEFESKFLEDPPYSTLDGFLTDWKERPQSYVAAAFIWDAHKWKELSDKWVKITESESSSNYPPNDPTAFANWILCFVDIIKMYGVKQFYFNGRLYGTPELYKIYLAETQNNEYVTPKNV